MNSKEKMIDFFKKFHALEISWQVYSLILLYFIVMIITAILNWKIGLMLLFLLFIVILFFSVNMKNFIRNIHNLANDISKSATESQEDALYQAPIAIVLYDDNERIRWINPTFQRIYESRDLLGSKMTRISPDYQEVMNLKSDGEWHEVVIDKRIYDVLHRKEQQAIYLIDITEQKRILDSRNYDMIVFGYMFLDDYTEICETMDDQQVAKFDADLLKEINQWAKLYNIYTKRLDSEKFILIFNKQVLSQLEDTKFIFFDELRERNYRRNVPISISLGIAYPEDDDEDYGINDLADQAQLNLDLAFGRGGDQIVVRSQTGRARFYGGKTNPYQRRSSIRSRLFYQALKTQIDLADNVLITGHKYPDTDSIGAAIGVHKIVSQQGKDARVIVNQHEFSTDIQQLLTLDGAPNWSDILIEHDKVDDFINENTLIIMVDHHRPSLSEAEDYMAGHDIVVIDHHRRGEEYPENTVLSYIETYASSTSELITEFFMSIRNTTRAINKYEATALLAGIIVDTNNFSTRTTSETFEVASYLKSRGGDTNAIHRILKEDLTSVITRNRLLEKTEIFDGGYAIVRGDQDEVVNTIIAAQTADLMLSISEVEASFIIFKRSDGAVGISARSLGRINVQRIMERLGGGGHLSTAATQMYDVTIDEAYTKLLEVIEINKEE